MNISLALIATGVDNGCHNPTNAAIAHVGQHQKVEGNQSKPNRRQRGGIYFEFFHKNVLLSRPRRHIVPLGFGSGYLGRGISQSCQLVFLRFLLVVVGRCHVECVYVPHSLVASVASIFDIPHMSMRCRRYGEGTHRACQKGNKHDERGRADYEVCLCAHTLEYCIVLY